jgi:hypothetical protein
MIRAVIYAKHPVQFYRQFDATSWFEQATSKQIASLANGRWGRDVPAGEIAAFVAANEDDKLAAIFTTLSRSKKAIAFDCIVVGADATKWLALHRQK